MADDGRYEVVERGGNLSILVYGDALAGVVEALRRASAVIGGKVEAPKDLRFIVATVPVSVGFPAVERAVREALGSASAAQWFYGNVYDEQDQPLNWWATTAPNA